MPILPSRNTLLDLDCEIVIDMNAGIFSCLWDERAFKMRIHEGFQHGAGMDKIERLYVQFLTYSLHHHFFLFQESIFERKCVKVTLFMVEPQTYSVLLKITF